LDLAWDGKEGGIACVRYSIISDMEILYLVCI
jgi:hypothetical protein